MANESKTNFRKIRELVRTLSARGAELRRVFNLNPTIALIQRFDDGFFQVYGEARYKDGKQAPAHLSEGGVVEFISQVREKITPRWFGREKVSYETLCEFPFEIQKKIGEYKSEREARKVAYQSAMRFATMLERATGFPLHYTLTNIPADWDFYKDDKRKFWIR